MSAIMLCAYPGCQNVAEVVPDGQPIPAGAIGRTRLFCAEHRALWPRCSVPGCTATAVVWISRSAANAMPFCAEHGGYNA